jgi:hypothetical protein
MLLFSSDDRRQVLNSLPLPSQLTDQILLSLPLNSLQYAQTESSKTDVGNCPLHFHGPQKQTQL